jgi:hypothetical protein
MLPDGSIISTPTSSFNQISGPEIQKPITQRPLPATLYIPPVCIAELKKRLPMLVGKKGELKVSKQSFRSVIDELDKMGFMTDTSGKVTKKPKVVEKKAPPPPPKQPNSGKDLNGYDVVQSKLYFFYYGVSSSNFKDCLIN